MKTENVNLMKDARESLKGKWGLAIGAFAIMYLINIAIALIPEIAPSMTPFSTIISILLAGPFAWGLAVFSLSLSRGQEAKTKQVFEGFNHFVKSLGAYLLMVVFILLWSLLLIIPGIIASISYTMTFYILADDPSVKPMEAIDRSKKMMYGYKAKFFWLSLRFLLWSLLCLLTLGIGFLWLIPYMQITFAKFYDDIRIDQVVQ